MSTHRHFYLMTQEHHPDGTNTSKAWRMDDQAAGQMEKWLVHMFGEPQLEVLADTAKCNQVADLVEPIVLSNKL